MTDQPAVNTRPNPDSDAATDPDCTCPFRWTTHYRTCPRFHAERAQILWPDDVGITSIDVCAWCGDSECDGTGHWADLDANDLDDQVPLEELHSLLREGQAWRIAKRYGMEVAERMLDEAENRT